MSETWDAVYRTEQGARLWPNEELVRFVAGHFSTGQGHRALDIGCGLGGNLWFLQDAGFEAEGCDVSMEAVVRANDYLSRRGGMRAVRNGSADALPYEGEEFNLVCELQCFQHVQPWSHLMDAVKEAQRVLRRGGWFFSYGLQSCTDYGGQFPDMPNIWGLSEDQWHELLGDRMAIQHEQAFYRYLPVHSYRRYRIVVWRKP